MKTQPINPLRKVLGYFLLLGFLMTSFLAAVFYWETFEQPWQTAFNKTQTLEGKLVYRLDRGRSIYQSLTLVDSAGVEHILLCTSQSSEARCKPNNIIGPVPNEAVRVIVSDTNNNWVQAIFDSTGKEVLRNDISKFSPPPASLTRNTCIISAIFLMAAAIALINSGKKQ